jgi:hypothetical protein
LHKTWGRVVKRLKESDLVVSQPSNLFGDFSIQVIFKIQTNNSAYAFSTI